MPTDNYDLVKQDADLLNDRFRDLEGVLTTLARYADDPDVRNYADGGLRNLELIVKDTQQLVGSMLTAVQVLKQQRDSAIEEAEYERDEAVSEAYDMGYQAAQEDGELTEADLQDAYAGGFFDATHKAEAKLGMSLDDAADYIEQAAQALDEWQQTYGEGKEAA